MYNKIQLLEKVMLMKNYNKTELYKILEEEIETFFPKDGIWYSNCFSKPKEVGYGNMPCHLRDNKWLTSLMLQKLDLNNTYYDEVYAYLLSSNEFQEKRHEYELEIVKWQINFTPDGEGLLMDEAHGSDLWKMTEDCDKSFRWSVKHTLEAIGMNSDVIEEGLEKYSDLWRDTYMKLAFNNRYNPLTSIPYLIGRNDNLISLSKPDEKHKEKWLELRKYEYYLEHKTSVDNYGDKSTLVTEIDPTDIAYVYDMDKIRKKEIEIHEQQFKPKYEIEETYIQNKPTYKSKIKSLIGTKKSHK